MKGSTAGVDEAPGQLSRAPGGRELEIKEFKMDEEVDAGKGESPRLTMHEVIKKSVSVLRKDSKVTMRSNTERLAGCLNPIFPLKKIWEEDLEQVTPRSLAFDAAAGVFTALNHLAGFGSPTPHVADEPFSSTMTRPSDTYVRAIAEKNVVRLALRNPVWMEEEKDFCFTSFFKQRNVDYSGEVIRTAQKLCWAGVRESLPNGVGSLSLESFCRLGTLNYVLDFEEYLIPVQERQYVKPPKMMVQDGQWELLVEGLVNKGVCEIMALGDIYHLDNKPVLNGLFAVGKGELQGELETQRLIMNLTPVNALCRSLAGDVSTLPALAGMNGYLLEEGEVLLLSSEDIRCFFYLIAVPKSWKRFLGFNRLVPKHLIPPHLANRDCVMVSRVVPMGFINSVSIAQHVHRNVVRWSAQQSEPPIGGLMASIFNLSFFFFFFFFFFILDSPEVPGELDLSFFGFSLTAPTPFPRLAASFLTLSKSSLSFSTGATSKLRSQGTSPGRCWHTFEQ